MSLFSPTYNQLGEFMADDELIRIAAELQAGTQTKRAPHPNMVLSAVCRRLLELEEQIKRSRGPLIPPKKAIEQREMRRTGLG